MNKRNAFAVEKKKKVVSAFEKSQAQSCLGGPKQQN
jgi:hypothetical protein